MALTRLSLRRLIVTLKCMETETKSVIMGILFTLIICSIILTLVKDIQVSHAIYQMGVCMENKNIDMVTCQTTVDPNFSGTNTDK